MAQVTLSPNHDRVLAARLNPPKGRPEALTIELEGIPLINGDALDHFCKQVSPNYCGHSTRRGLVCLHFINGAAEEEMNAAKQVALKHDPSLLCPQQIEAKARFERKQAVMEALQKMGDDDPLAAAIRVLLEELR